METTDFCSYELSKRLKDCGFDEPCDCYYTNGYANPDPEDLSRIVKLHRDSLYNYNMVIGADGECVSAPSLYVAQKWLREVKHISVRVSYIHYHKVWFADWLNLDSGEFDDTDATFATYGEALADGISVALELIKKGE